MQSGKDDVTVKLVRPIPVYIVYGTAIAYPDGEVHFYDDLYGHDAALGKVLAKGYQYFWGLPDHMNTKFANCRGLALHDIHPRKYLNIWWTPISSDQRRLA